MAMQVPVAIDQIDFDAAAQRFAIIHANCSVAKIGAGFAVPGPKLNDLDLVAGGAGEMLSEFAGEPARLNFQLVWRSERKKQSALMDACGAEHCSVARTVLGGGQTLQL